MSTTLSTITTLINDRRRDSGSLSVDMTQEGFRAINGTLQIWNQGHDWPWQLQETLFNYNNGINRYNVLTSGIDFKAIVNVRPYKPQDIKDELYYVGQNAFDGDSIHTKRFAVETKGQKNYLRCQYRGYDANINTITDPSTNGTWVASGAVSNLAADTYDTFEQNSSISFSYSGTSGAFTNSTMTAQDLSRYVARSQIYLNLNLQSVTNFTSVTIQVGSDASDYITATATTDYVGNPLVVGWNRLAFPWTGTTTVVGNPVYTAINYVQVTLAYGSTSTTVMNNIENLWVSENIPMILDYYSNNMVLDAADSNQWQIFQNSANTTDTALWSGQWDFVNEPFITSAMEIVAYLTDQRTDEQDATAKALSYIEPLKELLPSKRRYSQVTLAPDINGEYYGPRPTPYRRYYP
jgi:hypothetical protein